MAKKLLDEEPRALFTHCYGHALNCDTIKQCKTIKDLYKWHMRSLNL